ncbi:SufD family Fe-S cluster assembly protein [Prochlorococcus sp. MIT 1341]|uniref:SufB/SufD family protein n=1 Tax=Prochlorococcus sp. MIT 1341 TaxID=3096221 RepID=UPI002A747EA1|nr:SufD family Fe-S cluster assembly protein [Prochlorococcus sp. MIT 1341]
MTLQKSKLWESLPLPQGPLAGLQSKARKSLESIGFPVSSEEAWRLTDLKLIEEIFNFSALSRSSNLHHVKEFAMPSPPKDGFRLALYPGLDPLSLRPLPDGFSLLDSSELEKTLGRTLKRCGCSQDWPVILNNSCTDNVLALRVKGSDLPSLELVLQGFSGELASSRVILLLEENTQLNLLQVCLGLDQSAHSHLIEIFVGCNASLNHEWLALGGGEASCLANIAIEQEPQSEYALTCVQQGWSFSRLEPYIVQLGGRANTKLRGLQVADHGNQISTNSKIRFDGPEGHLHQIQKGIAAGTSHSIFNGSIEVPQAAQRTNAAQLSRNLLLSNRARIDAKPELKIIADDVKCTHGATVTQLQEEELFYMLSRGIGQTDATKLLLKGFCQEITYSLPISAGRWKVLDQVLKNLRVE